MTKVGVDDVIVNGAGVQEIEALPRMDFTPLLAREGYFGLAGRIVETIEPTSEADPAAILLHVLVSMGNLIGRGTYATVERAAHACNEYVVLVGQSAKGRKGQAWSTQRAIFDQVDPEWVNSRLRSGD
jgi:hypothetical protein